VQPRHIYLDGILYIYIHIYSGVAALFSIKLIPYIFQVPADIAFALVSVHFTAAELLGFVTIFIVLLQVPPRVC